MTVKLNAGVQVLHVVRWFPPFTFSPEARNSLVTLTKTLTYVSINGTGISLSVPPHSAATKKILK